MKVKEIQRMAWRYCTDTDTNEDTITLANFTKEELELFYMFVQNHSPKVNGIFEKRLDNVR